METTTADTVRHRFTSSLPHGDRKTGHALVYGPLATAALKASGSEKWNTARPASKQDFLNLLDLIRATRPRITACIQCSTLSCKPALPVDTVRRPILTMERAVTSMTSSRNAGDV
jgi:hypothetical protein